MLWHDGRVLQITYWAKQAVFFYFAVHVIDSSIRMHIVGYQMNFRVFFGFVLGSFVNFAYV